MDVEIALQNLYQAHLTLAITHSEVPENEVRLRELETEMHKILDDFKELVR